ncbi:Reticulocyte-binding protein 2 a [Phytophthora citrophthora]|uniref:Reticulocyte-binding protein 2 a n=1 Tax=Phytophthora citrophthora TaxID=4793 RepID=A0AAD9LAT0_9STRA|nr:Reticulocyte-binding protein 2 a [Phytophthora citrophthora]
MQGPMEYGLGSPSRQNVTVIDCAATGARINSPRSLEACRRMGIKPSELLTKTVVEFLDHGVNRKYSLVEKEAAVLRHEHFEQLRQQKLETVRAEREAILSGLGPAPPSTALLSVPGTTGSPTGEGSPIQQQTVAGFPPRRTQSARPWMNSTETLGDSTLLQLEERRLARIKLRQQKDIQNAIEMEAKLVRLQQENARRAAEEAKRQEDQHRKMRQRRMQLAAAKHEKELAKKRDEDKEALERKTRRRSEAERERVLVEEEKEKARQRALEAAQRDLERQQNADAWRIQTEELLRQQEEVVAANRRRMLEKERQVAVKIEAANKRRHQEALERREKANARIQNVTYQNELALARKKQEVTDKQTAAAERGKEIQRKTANELKERAAKSKQDESVRQKRLEAAHALREKHVSELLLKRDQLEAKMEDTQQEREKARLLAQVEHQLGVSRKEQNVERIQRMEAYARDQLMRRISSADARSRAVKERKQALLQTRQQVATEAMIRRHRLADAVEKMRTTSAKWEKIEETLYVLSIAMILMRSSSR